MQSKYLKHLQIIKCGVCLSIGVNWQNMGLNFECRGENLDAWDEMLFL
jgi:hypothetical protein